MKQVLILILFSFLILALNAQTGIFDLSYDSTREEADDTLTSNGFTVYSDEDNIVAYYDSTNEYVDSINLRFNKDTGTLDEWFVAYLPQEEEDIAQIALNAVKSYHDDWDEYDEDSGLYTWNFSETRYILAGFDATHSFFWVEYRDTAYESERPGATSEDDSYDSEYWNY